ncbi:MAG: AsnC family transcriptional regulator, partial [Pseudomonadota bacterium]
METLDEKDRKLLVALKQNARASLVALARDIGLSRSATHDRIVRLEEKGVIQGYTIIERPDVSPGLRAFLTVQLEPSTRDFDIAPAISKKSGVEDTFCLTGDIDILV